MNRYLIIYEPFFNFRFISTRLVIIRSSDISRISQLADRLNLRKYEQLRRNTLAVFVSDDLINIISSHAVWSIMFAVTL
jgi:hypothetical protein